MKLRNILLILAAITLGFASCSSESDILSEIDTPVNGLDEETVAVSFNLGKDLQTKAGNETQDASDDEATIHNCVIAIFDHATGTMLAKKEFTATSGLERKGNTYTTTNIETKAIPSDVIVVANCPVGFFNNVVTKEGFDKVVNEYMDGLTESTLTASNLIKVWKSEEEPQYANGIDLKDPSQRNISVNVRQIAARVDLDLRVINMAETALDEKTFLSIHSVTMTNINTQTKLFTENGIDASIKEKSEGNGLINNAKSITIYSSEESKNEYTSTATFYTYEKLSNTPTSELTIEAYLVVKGQNSPQSLKKIVIKGEGNGLMKRGNLYKILGTIDYHGTTGTKVTVNMDYSVMSWTDKTVGDITFS